MSAGPLALALPAIPIPKFRWFKGPDAEENPENPADFDNWPRAARRLWKILLRWARSWARRSSRCRIGRSPGPAADA